MVEDVLDVIVSNEGESWTVTSPQLPGFAGGRDSQDELRQDVPSMLRFAGVDIGATDLKIHQEVVHNTLQGDFVVRVANDANYDARVQVALRIERALTIEAQREEMWTAPHTSTGDVLFICAVPSDTIGWCARQLARGDHGATVVLGLGEDLIWATHLYTDIGFADSAHPLNHYGWSSDTTLGEVMHGGPFANRPPQLLLTA